MNVHDEDDFVFVCLLGWDCSCPSTCWACTGQDPLHHALPSLLALLKIDLYDLHSSVFATQLKLFCRFGCFILLVRPPAPCQAVLELQVNRSTPGRIVIERDKMANIPHSSPRGPWEIVANPDKTCSYPKQPQLNRNLTWQTSTQLHRIVSCRVILLLPVSLLTLSKFCYGL